MRCDENASCGSVGAQTAIQWIATVRRAADVSSQQPHAAAESERAELPRSTAF